MVTLYVCPNFKGTTSQFAKALLLCLTLDSTIIILNYTLWII